MLIRSICCVLFITAAVTAAIAQELPSGIRGYKVFRAKVTVTATDSGRASADDAQVRINDPKVESVGLSGVGLAVGGEVSAKGQNGTVDFLTFRDIRINGVAVEIGEYDHPFAFKDGETVGLPYPFSVQISARSIARAVFKDLIESNNKWAVTGTVFVFGRFRKYGFTFKRVIPVPIDIEIANPIKTLTDSVK